MTIQHLPNHPRFSMFAIPLKTSIFYYIWQSSVFDIKQKCTEFKGLISMEDGPESKLLLNNYPQGFIKYPFNVLVQPYHQHPAL